MAFDLKRFLEEAAANVNPFDGGKTAATISANRNKVQPAQTVAKPVAMPKVQQPAQVSPAQSRRPQKSVWENLGDFGKTIGSGVQQGVGAIADVAVQGGGLLGRAGVQTNPFIDKQKREKQLQSYDQNLVNGQNGSQSLRQSIQSQKDLEGKNIVGTSDVDQNAVNIANGRGNLQDFGAIAGKGLQIGLDATMFANPARLAAKAATGAVKTPGSQLLKYAARDAGFFGGTQGAATAAQTYGQTGDIGQALKAGGQSALLTGLTAGGMDIAGAGLGKAINVAKNTPREVKTSNLIRATDSVGTKSTPVSKLTSFEGAPDRARVAEYKQQIQQGKPIDPIIVMRDSKGKLGIEDGKHRYQAARELGITSIPTREVNPGNMRAVAQRGSVGGEVPKQRATQYDTPLAPDMPIPRKGYKNGQPIKPVEPALNETNVLSRTPQEAAGVTDGVVAKVDNRTPDMARTADTRYNRTLQGSDQVSKPVKKNLAENSPEYKVETEQMRFTESARKREAMGDQAFTRDVRARLEDKLGTADSQTIADAQTAAARADADGDYVTATEIYDKMSEHLTKAGQTVQAAAILARRSPEGLRFHAQKQLTKAGIELTPERQKAIVDYTNKVRDAQNTLDNLNKKGASPADIRKAEADVATARENVQYYVASQIPAKLADKLVNFWRAGLLTAPTTTGGAVLGNAETLFTRKLWTNPAAAMADYTMSIFTGKRTQSLAKAGEFGKGALEGGKQSLSKDYWRTGRDPMMDGQKLGKYDQPIHKLNYGQGKLGKTLGGYVNGVYSLMGAADKPFRYGAYRESLSSQARSAIDTMRLQNKKMTRTEAKQMYDGMMEAPTPEMVQRATDEALYETFQNKTVLGDAIGNMKQWAKREGHTKTAALMDFLMPFTGVPSAIAARVIQRTPIGTANEIVKQIWNVKRNGGNFDQRAMARAIGEGTAGIPIIAAGAALAGSGAITGGYPRDEKTHKEWEQTGKQPNSILINGEWQSLNYLQPFGTLLAIGQSIGDSRLDDDKLQDTIVKGMLAAGNSVVSMSFLSGLSDALSLATEGASESSMTRFVGNTASSVIPNFIRSATRAADDMQREVKGDNFFETVINSVAGAVPGARQTLEPKLDQFGQPLPAKNNFFNQFLNPLKPSKSLGESDATVKELSRLLSVDSGVKPTTADKGTFKDHELTNSEIREINTLAGPAMKVEYDKLIKSPEYTSLSDEDKVKAIKRINDVVYGSIKNKYGVDKGYLTAEQAKLDSNQRRYAQGSGVNYITGGIGDTKLSSDSNAYKYLDTKPEMTDDEKSVWNKEPVSSEYQPLIESINSSLPEGWPRVANTNEVAELYAKFEKNKADKNWSQLQTQTESKNLLANAYKANLSDNERFITSLSDKDIISAANAGMISKEELDKIIATDDALIAMGKTPALTNKTRAAFGYGGGIPSTGSGRKSGSKKDYKLYGFAQADPNTVTGNLRKLIENAKI